ncbi:hypothetical protein ATPR_0240 [Acetobacter tropicalis NBRC 101654]|uniref:Uncharacterized protein n=1 Tax=Acetobacter tropicalis NBRC 101654 TaxID=749388 RepID=F7VA41_9PROT|nr:hypothetical protein ATPR_0240 [Acetobacter tropicalis NBRC 101654]
MRNPTKSDLWRYRPEIDVTNLTISPSVPAGKTGRYWVHRRADKRRFVLPSCFFHEKLRMG